MKTFRPLWLLILAAIHILAGSNACADWEVEGTLTYSPHLPAPRQTEKKEFTFRLISDGCRSLIRTTRLDSGDYVEALIERNVIHTLYYFTKTNLQSGGKPVQIAEITRREIPRDDASNIGYLWLAYGSACYFDSRTNNRLAPLWIQDDPTLERQGFTMEAVWSRETAERLPRRVAYLNDGMKRTQRGGASVVEPWRPPYDRGFKHALYETLSGTNLHGVFVPTEFTFTRNGLRPDGDGGLELKVVTRTEVKAATVSESTGLALTPPRYAGIVGIVDYRYARSNPPVSQIWHSATNGVWPDDKQAAQAYEKQVRIREKLNKISEPSEPKR